MKPVRRTIQSIYFPLIIFSIAILLTVFKLHGSSISLYPYFFTGSFGKDLILGNPRLIRSDEWMVQTPWIISQSQTNFSETNPFFGTGMNFSLSDIPVRNWTIIFRPQYWGFFILPIEYAFSWTWWFRAWLLILSTYLVMLRITRGNILYSVLFAVAFFFSPFVQWWYSTSVLEILAFGFFLLFVFIKLVEAQRLSHLLFYGFTFTYLSCCFTIPLYPPFQVPIAICMVFFILGYLIRSPQFIFQSQGRRFFPVFIASLFLIVVIGFSFYQSNKEIFQIILHTSYPGQRRVTGGGLNPLLLLGGFFNLQLLSDQHTVPASLINQSEASSFLLISLFLLPIILICEIRKIILHRAPDWVILFACIYLIMLLCWCFLGLPEILAKIFLLSFVPVNRALIGFGTMNILMIAYYLFQYNGGRIIGGDDLELPPDIGLNTIKRSTSFYKKSFTRFAFFPLIFSLFVAVIYLCIGLTLRNNYPKFIPESLRIPAISILVGLLIYFLLHRNKLAFTGLFLLVSIEYSFAVNPIASGLSSVLNSELSSVVHQIKDTDPTQNKWVVYDTQILSDYLAANGVPVISGVFYYPDLKLWNTLDPESNYEQIWNRYSRVIFREDKSDQAVFMKVQEDNIEIKINPCSAILHQARVKYYVFINTVSHPCLKEIARVNYPDMPIYIYQYSSGISP
jgi:hypothetical protein